MSWFDYYKNTPLAQIRADWQDYCNHKKLLKIGKKEELALYNQLQGKYPAKQKCMENDAPIVVGGHAELGTRYCMNFFKDNCKAVCPMHDVHNRYWAQHRKCEEMKATIRNYWQDKFNNAKTK